MNDILSLLKALENRISKSEVIRLAGAAETDFSLNDLLQLTLNTEHPSVAFRSSWLLETIVINHPVKFSPYTYHFLEIYSLQTNPGCQRLFTKVMMLCLKNTEFGSKKYENILDRIVEATFDWLAGDTPVAVKVNCMDVLYLLKSRKRWIEEELKAQIEFLMRDGSPAIQSRGRRLLQQFKTTI